MGAYFAVEEQNGGTVSVTDQVRHTNFFTRQRMLATAYKSMGALASGTMCDLGGSNGYYSFLAAQYGFDSLLVVDPRPEHEEQHAFIRDRMGGDGRVQFVRGDITLPAVAAEYDLLLVQGLLYHLYDHVEFLRTLRGMTRRFLILETELSGDPGLTNLVKVERVEDLRMGSGGIATDPSYACVLALLRFVGFGRVKRISPPPDEMDLHGYSKGRRVMLLCEPV